MLTGVASGGVSGLLIMAGLMAAAFAGYSVLRRVCVRGNTTSTLVQIDHVVWLSDGVAEGCAAAS